MTTTETTQENAPDPNTILCRVMDVNKAISNSFQRFIEAESKTLDDLANFLREEMSQLELFVPNAVTDTTTQG
jgi:hypothetical protein